MLSRGFLRLGFRAQGLGFRFRVSDLGFRVPGNPVFTWFLMGIASTCRGTTSLEDNPLGTVPKLRKYKNHLAVVGLPLHREHKDTMLKNPHP